jgi:PAS domain S-box-containing protein
VTQNLHLTGVERAFGDNDIIVSKTDMKGRLTYANRVFCDISGLTEREALGQPHSLIRHPEMPRCIFKLLWSTLESGKEIFAYVINRAMNGDHYWVYAHVTPSVASSGETTGYHSNRRVPDRKIVSDEIIPLYKTLLDEEGRHANRKDGMAASYQLLLEQLKKTGLEYDEFITTLGQRRRRGFR